MREWLIKKLGGIPREKHEMALLDCNELLERVLEDMQDYSEELEHYRESTPKRDPKTGRYVKRDG